MFRTPTIICLSLLVLIISACAPLVSPSKPMPPKLLPTNFPPIMGIAVVQSVDVQILESSPLQVNAIVRGQLPDGGCTTIASADQVRDGNTFRLTLTTTTDPLVLCAMALTPFEQVATLDVDNLPPAKYTVNANGIERSFELLTRNIWTFDQQLVDALNVRNYDLLRVMMDDSFMIVTWRSEGTNYQTDSAIQQLQMNYLNTTNSLVLEPSKNLIELLGGVDPVSILGPDLGLVSPIYVSGFGADGKDEAILYVGTLSDGSLFWHGLLFAKGGFAPTIPVTGSNPTPVASPPAPAPSVIPTITILSVVEDKSVTIRANNYPADTKFDVLMGKMGTNGVDGIKVDSIDSRNGGTFTASFEIPRKLRGEDRIAIRLESNSGYYSYNWFENATSDFIPNDPKITKVKYVKSLDHVVIRTGPGSQYRAIGTFDEGQTAKVIGVSADGNWWAIFCPVDLGDACWVSTQPTLTKPVDSAGNN
jgi:hypothetical protein